MDTGGAHDLDAFAYLRIDGGGIDSGVDHDGLGQVGMCAIVQRVAGERHQGQVRQRSDDLHKAYRIDRHQAGAGLADHHFEVRMRGVDRDGAERLPLPAQDRVAARCMLLVDHRIEQRVTDEQHVAVRYVRAIGEVRRSAKPGAEIDLRAALLDQGRVDRVAA